LYNRTDVKSVGVSGRDSEKPTPAQASASARTKNATKEALEQSRSNAVGHSPVKEGDSVAVAPDGVFSDRTAPSVVSVTSVHLATEVASMDGAVNNPASGLIDIAESPAVANGSSHRGAGAL